MKIVQSLWSKPGQKKGHYNKCGWPDKKYNYFSWALSCHQFRKYYGEVELVTDKAGYDLLINKLNLPYTNVEVVLDRLNEYPSELWALGKIYAYRMQKEPFIHADGDVYVWERFDAAFEHSMLLCQHKEAGELFNPLYASVFVDMSRYFTYLPAVLDRSVKRNGSIVAVNAGILGGHNIDFFQQYTAEVFKMVDKNINMLDRINVGLSNIVFEQFLFHAMVEDNQQQVTYFQPSTTNLGEFFTDYTGVPSRKKYIHTPGSLKRFRVLSDSLEYRLLGEYPGEYYKIMELMHTHQI